jgi:Ecdysteroid kinase-like family
LSSLQQVVDADGITGEWLSHALARDVRLRSCEAVGTGQTAAAYRLVIDGGHDLPSSLVAKVSAGDIAARTKVRGGIRAEVGCYRHLLSTVDVRAPHCWYAEISEDALHFTLLLEDLAPRVPGVQVDGCTTAQAAASVRNLAGLHAPRWNDSALFDLDFLRPPDANGAAFLGGIAKPAADVFVDRYSDDLSPEDVDTLRATAAVIEPWLLSRTEPFAAIHGDYRLDNLMFGSAGAGADADVVAVDWQTLVVGLPARDVAYFLGTSLAVDHRRAVEHELVDGYHAALVKQGVSGYTGEQCFDDYRLGQIQGPMITMIGAAYATAERSQQADAMFLAMARRSCSAIRDLGSLDLL